MMDSEFGDESFFLFVHVWASVFVRLEKRSLRVTYLLQDALEFLQ